MSNLLPWCESLWKKLILLTKKNKLPHAILFYGNAGLGKTEFSLCLAHYLLCSDPNKNETACGKCKDCVLFSAKTHGDFYMIVPEGESKTISINQIRDLKTAVYQKPQRNRVKIFLIPRAEKMTLAASNALLKILEEPPGDSIFILTSEQRYFLPATILSRCQHFTFTIPDEEKTKNWLSTLGNFSEEEINAAVFWSLGSPLKAKYLLENKTTITEYQSYLENFLTYFLKKNDLFSLIKAWQGKSLRDIVYVAHIACYYLLKGKWGAHFDKHNVYRWVEKLIEIKKRMAEKIPLNETLVLDFLLSETNEKNGVC